MPRPPKARKRRARKTAGSKADKAFLRWETNPIPDNIERLSEYVDKTFRTTLKYYEPKIENHARINAPWKDQTTNARNGLIAQSGMEGSEYFIVLAHRVPYGIFLELRWNGKYAIIMPTIAHFAPIVMDTANKILEKFDPPTGS